ncbi:MAG: 5'/3'-nucleotidase SurE [Polyangiales bacterium]
MVDATNDASDTRPLILCANDDGIHSRGLKVLAEALSTFARVVVVAPETEQSATSHSITLHRPLRLRRVDVDRYALDGTPADCVYLAVHLDAPRDDGEPNVRVLPRKPDLVVSGINRGINLGQDVFYSGTVAAAREGALRGVPAIAASVEVKVDPAGVVRFDPSPVAELVVKIAKQVLALPKPVSGPALLLNLNAPMGPIRGVASTTLGTRLWTEAVDARLDPRGRPYFWIGGKGVAHAFVAGSDTEAFDAGLASLTALRLDLARDDEPAKQALRAITEAVR